MMEKVIKYVCVAATTALIFLMSWISYDEGFREASRVLAHASCGADQVNP